MSIILCKKLLCLTETYILYVIIKPVKFEIKLNTHLTL